MLDTTRSLPTAPVYKGVHSEDASFIDRGPHFLPIMNKNGGNYVKRILQLCCITLLVTGCMTASYHKNKVQDESGDRLTVGTVQREIKVGMSSAQVAEVLGSPNVVTTDEQRREVWVYDKVASDVTYSNSSGYGTLILVGMGGNSGSASTTSPFVHGRREDEAVRTAYVWDQIRRDLRAGNE